MGSSPDSGEHVLSSEFWGSNRISKSDTESAGVLSRREAVAVVFKCREVCNQINLDLITDSVTY